MINRKQIVLYLPSKYGEIIEEIRARIDPKQFYLIPAHISLCYSDEIDNWNEINKRLMRIKFDKFKLSFNRIDSFEEGGFYLTSAGDLTKYYIIRNSLLANSSNVRTNVRPHITLLHPRNVNKKKNIELNQIPKITLNEIEFKTISLIEQEQDNPWITVMDIELVD